jgi:hypothetical protein
VRRVPFSCIAVPGSFSAISGASGPVFLFCSPGLVFGGPEGSGSRFHVLRARTRYRWCRGHRVPFSCFALPDSFSAVQRALGPVFMICAPGLIFDGTGSGHVFLFCVTELVFGGIESVGSRFHVLRARTRFRLYRGRQVAFSYFALPDSFSVVPRASGPVFIFYSP